MKTEFYKYQGAGNDFVIIDNRKAIFPKEDHRLIRRLCDRRFGIGADGLMLLEPSTLGEFRMLYFNADGMPGSMCGNGGRCMVSFARSLGLFEQVTEFEFNGDLYEARMEGDRVSLNMLDVESIDAFEEHVFLDTGSPHHVTFTDNLKETDVIGEGSRIRHGEPYNETGTNVNFVQQINENTFRVRTYERGVEDETLSCGTGVTAVALASFFLGKTGSHKVNIQTRGGDLEVEFSFDEDMDRFSQIVLSGPATFVFKGVIEIN